MKPETTDCGHLGCHEDIMGKLKDLSNRIKTLCIKKVGWWPLVSIIGCILIAVGIPLFPVAADVWRGQGSDVYKYATKDDFTEWTSRVIAIETAQIHYLKAAKRTADAVEEIQKDLRYILQSKRFEPIRGNYGRTDEAN